MASFSDKSLGPLLPPHGQSFQRQGKMDVASSAAPQFAPSAPTKDEVKVAKKILTKARTLDEAKWARNLLDRADLTDKDQAKVSRQADKIFAKLAGLRRDEYVMDEAKYENKEVSAELQGQVRRDISRQPIMLFGMKNPNPPKKHPESNTWAVSNQKDAAQSQDEVNTLIKHLQDQLVASKLCTDDKAEEVAYRLLFACTQDTLNELSIDLTIKTGLAIKSVDVEMALSVSEEGVVIHASGIGQLAQPGDKKAKVVGQCHMDVQLHLTDSGELAYATAPNYSVTHFKK